MPLFPANFFTWFKSAAKRTTGLVLTVFMLQVVAAGFCAPMASATPVKQASSMEHCTSLGMPMAHTIAVDTAVDANMDMQHACAHCDLPDASIALDKHAFAVADIAAEWMIIAMAVTTTADIAVVSFVNSPQDLRKPSTSLSTFNLNLRIRV